MERLNYWQFPGFENIYLEDSYVLSINDKTSIQILLEAVLTENHSLYTQPLPEEQYCYRRMSERKFSPPSNLRFGSEQHQPNCRSRW